MYIPDWLVCVTGFLGEAYGNKRPKRDEGFGTRLSNCGVELWLSVYLSVCLSVDDLSLWLDARDIRASIPYTYYILDLPTNICFAVLFGAKGSTTLCSFVPEHEVFLSRLWLLVMWNSFVTTYFSQGQGSYRFLSYHMTHWLYSLTPTSFCLTALTSFKLFYPTSFVLTVYHGSKGITTPFFMFSTNNALFQSTSSLPLIRH